MTGLESLLWCVLGPVVAISAATSVIHITRNTEGGEPDEVPRVGRIRFPVLPGSFLVAAVIDRIPRPGRHAARLVRTREFLADHIIESVTDVPAYLATGKQFEAADFEAGLCLLLVGEVPVLERLAAWWECRGFYPRHLTRAIAKWDEVESDVADLLGGREAIEGCSSSD